MIVILRAQGYEELVQSIVLRWDSQRHSAAVRASCPLQRSGDPPHPPDSWDMLRVLSEYIAGSPIPAISDHLTRNAIAANVLANNGFVTKLYSVSLWASEIRLCAMTIS